MTGVLTGRGEKHREGGRPCDDRGSEIGVLCLQGKECERAPAGARSQTRQGHLRPAGFRGNMALLTPQFQTSGLQNSEVSHLLVPVPLGCCFQDKEVVKSLRNLFLDPRKSAAFLRRGPRREEVTSSQRASRSCGLSADTAVNLKADPPAKP